MIGKILMNGINLWLEVQVACRSKFLRLFFQSLSSGCNCGKCMWYFTAINRKKMTVNAAIVSVNPVGKLHIVQIKYMPPPATQARA